jgi:hypothetical protein
VIIPTSFGNCFRYEVQSYGDKVNSWFSVAIGRPCTFMRCSSSKYRSCTINGGRDRLCRDTRSKLSFVNEGQLLLVSEESISDLNSRLSSSMQFLLPLFCQKEQKKCSSFVLSVLLKRTKIYPFYRT